MSRISITSVVLLLFNSALAGLVTVSWNRGQERIKEPDELAVQPLELPDLSALNSTPMHSVDVKTIRDQSAFYAARSFYQPPAAAVELPAPDYEMAGTLRLIDGRRIAFVRRKTDRSSRALHVGEDLEGWRVRVIEPERIVLDQAEHMTELRNPTASANSGLIRNPNAAGTVHTQAGLRILGSNGPHSTLTAGQMSLREASTYHPPPSAGQ